MIEQELLDVLEVLLGELLERLRLGLVLVLLEEAIPLRLGLGERGQLPTFGTLGVTGLALLLVEVFPLLRVPPLSRT